MEEETVAQNYCINLACDKKPNFNQRKTQKKRDGRTLPVLHVQAWRRNNERPLVFLHVCIHYLGSRGLDIQEYLTGLGKTQIGI